MVGLVVTKICISTRQDLNALNHRFRPLTNQVGGLDFVRSDIVYRRVLIVKGFRFSRDHILGRSHLSHRHRH